MPTINIINSPVTGSNWVVPSRRKPGCEHDDFGARDLIDAPDWVPTGSHELHETQGNGWTHQIVFGEHFRAGLFS